MLSKAKVIINYITVFGIVTSVIILLVIGIKYMVGSIEQKAEYKKTMIPYIIGVILIISITTIVSLIANITVGILNN